LPFYQASCIFLWDIPFTLFILSLFDKKI